MGAEQEAAALPAADDVNKACLEWYLGLHSRVLDLVGDYAGSERFLIEGDSLLRHCFEDSKIDFEGEYSVSYACSSTSVIADCQRGNRRLPTPSRGLRSGTLPRVSRSEALQLPRSLLRRFVLLRLGATLRGIGEANCCL